MNLRQEWVALTAAALIRSVKAGISDSTKKRPENSRKGPLPHSCWNCLSWLKSVMPWGDVCSRVVIPPVPEEWLLALHGSGMCACACFCLTEPRHRVTGTADSALPILYNVPIYFNL